MLVFIDFGAAVLCDGSLRPSLLKFVDEDMYGGDPVFTKWPYFTICHTPESHKGSLLFFFFETVLHSF